MGLFFDLSKIDFYNINSINEGAPEEDNQDQDNTDYTDTDDDAGTENNTNTDTNDDNAENNNTDENDAGNDDNNTDENNDYTADLDTGDDDGGDGDNPDTDGGDAGGGDDNDKAEVDEIKKQEEELYSNLSPEQLDIKHKELKRNFLAMFDVINAIIDKITSANLSEENTTTIEFVSNNLNSLKNMLIDYMNDVYKTKSYTENLINYNRYLAALNAINKILEEMDI